jgi:hypothetical protein
MRIDYHRLGSDRGLEAAQGLSDERLMLEIMLDKSYVTALADSTALTAAEMANVKKSTATFFTGFKNAFLRAIENRQRELTEKAKPVFWGTKASREEAWASKDTRLWTLASVMDDVKAAQKNVVEECDRIIRDATNLRNRAQATMDAPAVNDRLYPVYEENLGNMGCRADMAVTKLRQLQESTRTMIGLCGMRLPSREELVLAGIINEVEE